MGVARLAFFGELVFSPLPLVLPDLPQRSPVAVEGGIDGADVVFVCPESQTPFMRGESRSPISGIAHLDYIAVERADTP